MTTIAYKIPAKSPNFFAQISQPHRVDSRWQLVLVVGGPGNGWSAPSQTPWIIPISECAWRRIRIFWKFWVYMGQICLRDLKSFKLDNSNFVLVFATYFNFSNKFSSSQLFYTCLSRKLQNLLIEHPTKIYFQPGYKIERSKNQHLFLNYCSLTFPNVLQESEPERYQEKVWENVWKQRKSTEKPKRKGHALNRRANWKITVIFDLICVVRKRRVWWNCWFNVVWMFFRCFDTIGIIKAEEKCVVV